MPAAFHRTRSARTTHLRICPIRATPPNDPATNLYLTSPAVQNFGTTVVAALTPIGAAFMSIVNAVGSFISSLGQIKLPWFLTPGSPTPMETGLTGVLGTIQAINRVGMPNFSAAGGIPGSAFPGGPVAQGMRRSTTP